MIIAVTGANGHVGVNLCKALLDQGHEVRAFTHKNSQGLKNLAVKIYKGDLLAKESISPFLTAAEVVFHLAAKISITGDPDGMVNRINVEGTKNLIEVAIRCNVRKFIHFSSIHAFKQYPLDQSLDETRPLVSGEGFAYDRSKAEGERAVMASVNQGLNALVLSPTAIIGPADPEPSLTGQAVLDLYHRKIPALVPGGYDWVDVRDVVAAAISSIENGRKGEKYLLSGHWHSIKELSGLIRQHTKKKTVMTVLPFWSARIGLPFISLFSKMTGTQPLYTSESLTIIKEGNRLISNNKAKQELGFDPRPLSDSLRDMLVWFQANEYLKN